MSPTSASRGIFNGASLARVKMSREKKPAIVNKSRYKSAHFNKIPKFTVVERDEKHRVTSKAHSMKFVLCKSVMLVFSRRWGSFSARHARSIVKDRDDRSGAFQKWSLLRVRRINVQREKFLLLENYDY